MQNKLLNTAAGFFVLPLIGVFTLSVVPQFWAYWLTFLMSTVIIFSMSSKQAWTRIRLPQVSILWLVLFGLTAIQWMLHMLHSNAAALTTMGYLLVAFLMTIAGSYYRHATGWASFALTLSRTITATALAISIIVILSVPQFALLFKLNAIASQYQSYAGLALAAGVISLLYWASSSRLHHAITLTYALVMLTGISIVMGGSGWLVLAGVLLMAIAQQTIAIKTQNGSREKRQWLRLALVAPVLFAVVRIVSPESQLQTPPLLDTLAVAMQVAIKHPLLGVGAGNVGWQSFLAITQPAIPGRVGVFNHAPNAFIQLWLEFGTVALLALLAALIGWLRTFAWKTMQLEQVWLISTIGILFVVSLISAPFHHAFYLMMVAFLLGAGDEKLQSVKQPWVAAISCVGIATALLVALSTAGIANAKLIQAERGSINHPDTTSQLQWVHHYSLLAPVAERVFASKIEVDASSIGTKLWVTESVMRYQPIEKIAFYHSLLLELSGKHQQSVSFLDATLKAYPIKLNAMLQYYSPYYMQVFLNVLFEARPPKKTVPATPSIEHGTQH